MCLFLSLHAILRTPLGRNDADCPFFSPYRTLKHDRAVVSQDCIEIIHDPRFIPQALMETAGRDFKRFDRKMCRFVSNVKEFYPDD